MSFQCRILAGGLLALLSAFPVSAQFRAAIEGTVTDITGAAVPAATVSLDNTQTGQKQVTQSSGEGFYRFNGLAPGRYTVSVEAGEFNDRTVKDIACRAEQTQATNISLTPGTVTETLTVPLRGTPPLQTENADVGGQLTTQQVEQPAADFGRDPYELIRLTPDVIRI